MPFFFMGYYAKNIDFKTYITKIPSLCAVLTLCAVYCIYFFVLNHSVDYILTGAIPYWSITKLTPIYSCLARCLLLLVATLMGIMVMRLTPTRASLSNWGSKTLFIYIYHSFAIEALKGAVTNDYFPKNEWALIAFSFILLIGLMFLSNLKIFNILLNPISYYYKNKH
jgi:fucose 4-O-acetylase-like acetyltransferase